MQVFEYLKNSGKECLIAFDEFQQISQYPQKNVEALHRTYIHNIHNAHFIFSGSQAHLLDEMFLSPKRPFYQSTSNRSIGKIDKDYITRSLLGSLHCKEEPFQRMSLTPSIISLTGIRGTSRK